jgi:hypothetical protein
MTIYVDDLQRYSPSLKYKAWCHMWTDGDIEELHRFAESIGLRRGWFQNHPVLQHYDITPTKRSLAIQGGAVPQSMQQLADFIKNRRRSCS